jgi:hypothetical protein
MIKESHRSTQKQFLKLDYKKNMVEYYTILEGTNVLNRIQGVL